MKNKQIFKIVAKLNFDKLSLLIDKGIDLNIYSEYPPCHSLLQFAIALEEHSDKSIAMVRAIMDSGVDVNAWDLEQQNNPIILAANYNNKDIVMMLLELGANPNVINDQGNFPLRYAVKLGNFDMAQILLENEGVDNINTPGGLSGMSPLGFAVNNGDIKMIALLLEFGADPIKHDNVYMTPIQRLQKNASIETRKMISELLNVE